MLPFLQTVLTPLPPLTVLWLCTAQKQTLTVTLTARSLNPSSKVHNEVISRLTVLTTLKLCTVPVRVSIIMRRVSTLKSLLVPITLVVAVILTVHKFHRVRCSGHTHKAQPIGMLLQDLCVRSAPL